MEIKTVDECLQRLHLLKIVLVNDNLNNVYLMGDFHVDQLVERTWSTIINFLLKIIYLSIFIFWILIFYFLLDHILSSNKNKIFMEDTEYLIGVVGSDHLSMVGNNHLVNDTVLKDTGKLVDSHTVEWSWYGTDNY